MCGSARGPWCTFRFLLPISLAKILLHIIFHVTTYGTKTIRTTKESLIIEGSLGYLRTRKMNMIQFCIRNAITVRHLASPFSLQSQFPHLNNEGLSLHPGHPKGLGLGEPKAIFTWPMASLFLSASSSSPPLSSVPMCSEGRRKSTIV